MIASFRDLKMWQLAVDLAEEIYTLTKKLPREEIYGLQSQMRRAAVSVASNIAEGSKRKSQKDFLQFLHIANGSCAELETQLCLTKRIYARIDTSMADGHLVSVQKMLGAYMRKMYGDNAGHTSSHV